MFNRFPLAYRANARRLLAACLAITIALQPGCVSRPATPQFSIKSPEKIYDKYVEEFQPALGNVAVVATATIPEVKFTGFARSKADAAGKHAGSVLGNCAEGAAGSRDPLFAILAIASCGIFVAPVAIVVGAAKAPGTEQIDRSEAAMKASLNARAVQDELRDEVLADAHAAGIRTAEVSAEKIEGAAQAADYRPLAADGVDTVLEVALTRVFSEKVDKDINPPLPLFMQAHIRVIRLKDNAEILDGDFSYHGKQLTYTQWTDNKAEQLGRALKAGYEAIAQDITDRVFLLYHYPDQGPQNEAEDCGLAPIEPSNGGVTGMQPVIRWQAFPRPSDIQAAPEDMKRIKNVRYDLLVGTGENGETPEVIYRREGLPEAMHTVETFLSAKTRYFWSARARFELDGRERVTEWSASCPLGSQLTVGGRLYRFYVSNKKQNKGTAR